MVVSIWPKFFENFFEKLQSDKFSELYRSHDRGIVGTLTARPIVPYCDLKMFLSFTFSIFCFCFSPITKKCLGVLLYTVCVCKSDSVPVWEFLPLFYGWFWPETLIWEGLSKFEKTCRQFAIVISKWSMRFWIDRGVFEALIVPNWFWSRQYHPTRRLICSNVLTVARGCRGIMRAPLLWSAFLK